ncbi:DUF3137 domain-containing protein [Geitlerinema sp. CS-897]|nr:DUF3137 domain-containing protein [Geitlerinema sp. CS-897]
MSKDRALREGITAFEQKRYSESIALLAPLCQNEFPRTSQQVTAWTALIRSHYACQQLEEAIELCTKLAAHPHPKVKQWGQQVLKTLQQRNHHLQVATKHETTQTLTNESSSDRPSDLPSSSTTLASSSESSQPKTPSESLSTLEIQQLLNQSKVAIRQKDYELALSHLDRYFTGVSTTEKNQQYWQAQTLLAQAYRGSGKLNEAVSLSEELARNANLETQHWAQRFLESVTASLERAKRNAEAAAREAEAEAQRLQAIEQARIEPRTVSELKRFYQKTLLKELKKIEKSRRSVLISVIAISGILLAIFIGSGILTSKMPKTFFILSTLWLTLWVFLYSFRTSQYGMGFKRNIVQKILEFIDPDEYLQYSPTGEMGAARNALTNSTLLGRAFPDLVRQDDYVSGVVGRTVLSFADVCAEKSSFNWLSVLKGRRRSSSYMWMTGFLVFVFGFPYAFSRIARGRKLVFSEFWEQFFESSISRTLLFKGLLYWSTFPKTFKTRTLVLSKKLSGKIGKNGAKEGLVRIKLEDPQFNKYFMVYGQDQVESRYILSTNRVHPSFASVRRKSLH